MQTAIRISTALLLGFSLMQCSRPENVLLPTAVTVRGTSRVDMLVATTRMKATTPGEMFSGERGADLSFASIAVSIPPAANRKIGDVQWPKTLPADPATDFVTLKADDIDLKTAKAWFNNAATHGGHHQALVFVHGFNTRFGDAVYRFAQIIHDSGTTAVPVLFTWPSRGSLFDYGYDRESTNYSRDALERVLDALVKDPSVDDVAVLSHSMGNWLALEALRQMAIRDGRIPAKIKTVMLAAPDVDVDVFREQMIQMGAKRPDITLFVSQDDRALAVSQRVWGNIPRLGAIDPTKEPYKAELAGDDIHVIDLTKLTTDDSLNHAKFAASPEIVQLIGTRLASGQDVTDGKVGLGDRLSGLTMGAAATVGSAAGLVLSAPLAVVDPDTRENLGGSISRLGDNIGDTVSGATP